MNGSRLLRLLPSSLLIVALYATPLLAQPTTGVGQSMSIDEASGPTITDPCTAADVMTAWVVRDTGNIVACIEDPPATYEWTVINSSSVLSGDLTLNNLHLNGYLEVDGTTTLESAVTINDSLFVNPESNYTNEVTVALDACVNNPVSIALWQQFCASPAISDNTAQFRLDQSGWMYLTAPGGQLGLGPNLGQFVVPADIYMPSGELRLASTTQGSATCLHHDSDRLYGDLDCNGIKDGSDAYLDSPGAPPVGGDNAIQTYADATTFDGDQTFTYDAATGLMQIENTDLDSTLKISTLSGGGGGGASGLQLRRDSDGHEMYLSMNDTNAGDIWRLRFTGPSSGRSDWIVTEEDGVDEYERMVFFDSDQIGVYQEDRPYNVSSSPESLATVFVQNDQDNMNPAFEALLDDTATGGYTGGVGFRLKGEQQTMATLGYLTDGTDHSSYLYLYDYVNPGPGLAQIVLDASAGASRISKGPLQLDDYLRLGDLAADPTQTPDYGELYAKDTGSGTELWWQTSAGAWQILNEAGSITFEESSYDPADQPGNRIDLVQDTEGWRQLPFAVITIHATNDIQAGDTIQFREPAGGIGWTSLDLVAPTDWAKGADATGTAENIAAAIMAEPLISATMHAYVSGVGEVTVVASNLPGGIGSESVAYDYETEDTVDTGLCPGPGVGDCIVISNVADTWYWQGYQTPNSAEFQPNLVADETTDPMHVVMDDGMALMFKPGQTVAGVDQYFTGVRFQATPIPGLVTGGFDGRWHSLRPEGNYSDMYYENQFDPEDYGLLNPGSTAGVCDSGTLGYGEDCVYGTYRWDVIPDATTGRAGMYVSSKAAAGWVVIDIADSNDVDDTPPSDIITINDTSTDPVPLFSSVTLEAGVDFAVGANASITRTNLIKAILANSDLSPHMNPVKGGFDAGPYDNEILLIDRESRRRSDQWEITCCGSGSGTAISLDHVDPDDRWLGGNDASELFQSFTAGSTTTILGDISDPDSEVYMGGTLHMGAAQLGEEAYIYFRDNTVGPYPYLKHDGADWLYSNDGAVEFNMIDSAETITWTGLHTFGTKYAHSGGAGEVNLWSVDENVVQQPEAVANDTNSWIFESFAGSNDGGDQYAFLFRQNGDAEYVMAVEEGATNTKAMRIDPKGTMFISKDNAVDFVWSNDLEEVATLGDPQTFTEIQRFQNDAAAADTLIIGDATDTGLKILQFEALGSLGYVYFDGSDDDLHIATGSGDVEINDDVVITGTTEVNLDCSTGDQYVTTTAGGVLVCGTDDGGAETNSLETVMTGVLANEIVYGASADTGAYAKISALTEETTPTSGDWLLCEESGGNLRKCDVGDLPTGGGGEANTGSNQGTDGVGVFDTKSGVDLQFRHVAPGSTKITTVLNVKDIDIDIAEANLVHDHDGVTGGGTVDHVDLANKGTNTHATIDSHLAAPGHFVPTDIDTDYGNETVTSTWAINDVGTGALTAYDLTVGDSTDYGILRIGDAVIGRTSNTTGYNLDGAMILQNPTGPVTGDIEFGFLDSGNLLRFALPKSGVGNATYNPRCFLNAGPAIQDSDIVTVNHWQTDTPSIFNNLSCDTATDGAQFGVQGDVEFEETLFVDTISESTAAAGVTIDGVLLKDSLIDHATYLSNVGTNTHAQIDTHLGSSSNPHSVTCAQATGCVTGAITGTGVTYENLSANGDIGFAAAQVPQGSLTAPLASPALTGTPTAPTAAATTDTTQIATTAFVKDQEHTVCKTIEDLVAADDDVPLFYFNGASTIVKLGCDSSAAATVNVQDGGGTQVDADLVCSTGGTITWDSSLSGTTAFTNGEKIQIDTVSESTPTWTTICIVYTTP